MEKKVIYIYIYFRQHVFYMDHQSLQRLWTDLHGTDGGVCRVPYWWRKRKNPEETTLYRLADPTIPSHIQTDKTALNENRTVNLRGVRSCCHQATRTPTKDNYLCISVTNPWRDPVILNNWNFLWLLSYRSFTVPTNCLAFHLTWKAVLTWAMLLATQLKNKETNTLNKPEKIDKCQKIFSSLHCSHRWAFSGNPATPIPFRLTFSSLCFPGMKCCYIFLGICLVSYIYNDGIYVYRVYGGSRQIG